MGQLAWYFNRLKAMSPREIVWRFYQKLIQRKELKKFRGKYSPIEPLYTEVSVLTLNAEATLLSGSLASPLPSCLQKKSTATDNKPHLMADEAIRLLAGFDYKDYATDWHAGFSTDCRWPLIPSYHLNCKQRDDIGDPRINWELNRHRQFIRLAVSGNLSRLDELLNDWTKHNPFLWGIAYVSPMEIALRAISWMTAARLIAEKLPKNTPPSPFTHNLINKLLTGAANMAEYLSRHLSGFSSANNHLIVEAAAVALAGILFNKSVWTEKAITILSRELQLQVSRDGVDLESSLHYHGFVLEAYLLVWREKKELGLIWADRLKRMAQFVAASRVGNNCWCIFGDDDEARIIDPGFGDDDYFDYLLNFYTELSGINIKELCVADQSSKTFSEGGYSFLRKDDIFLGIDHAPLGFGAIAAHGHNDILSFQMFVAGKPILIDPGTYLYNIDIARRNLFRSTRMHNTVVVNDIEQSQMLGAFLWGKKAESKLLEYNENSLTASVKGLAGVTHSRQWQLDSESANSVNIIDSFDQNCKWEANFIVAPGNNVAVIDDHSVNIGNKLSLTTINGCISVENVEVATSFGILAKTIAIRITGHTRQNCVKLKAQQPLPPKNR